MAKTDVFDGVKDGAEIHLQIQAFNGAPADGGSMIVSFGITKEKTKGFEEGIMLALAHALGWDDATSVEIITPDGRFD